MRLNLRLSINNKHGVVKFLIKFMIGTFALVLSSSAPADDGSLSFDMSPQVSAATSTAFVPSLYESPVFDVLNKTATSTGMLLETIKTIQYEPSDDKEVDWIVVRFKSDAGIRMRDNILKQVDFPGKASLSDDVKMGYESSLHNLKQSLLLHKRPIERYLKEIPETEFNWMQKEGERRSKTKLQNLNDYYRIPYEEGTRYKSVKSLLKSLIDNPLVEVSYTKAARDIAQTGLLYSTGESFRSEPSEGGVNAQGVTGVNSVNAAWEAFPNSALGQHVKVAVLDKLYDISHEDFPDNLIGFEALDSNPNYTSAQIQELKDDYDYYTNKPDSYHGNASAGIIASPVNGYPATGLVPEAAVVLDQLYCEGIPTSAARMGYEGVIGFIGIDTYFLGNSTHDYYGSMVPVDFENYCYSAIQTATALGVIVVIGSGNDDTNLDDSYFNDYFNPAIRDSGAIVAGASFVKTRTPLNHAYGVRIDAHAPGISLDTLLYSNTTGGRNKYTDSWGANSGSTAVVAGAVASIQSIAKGEYGITMTAREMRSIIEVEGVPQETPILKPIGSLPDVLKAAQVGIPRIIAERAANGIRAAGTVPPNYLLLLVD